MTYATALIYVEQRRAVLRQVALPPMAEDMAEVRTLYSALSRGTERLVFEGRVPESEHRAMRAPFQSGDFPFPVAYGYAAAGVVETGPTELAGRTVFALAPHQDRLRLPAEACVPLPDAVPPGRAVLAANAETALNALWDAGCAPGTRVAVIGAGLLGALVAMLADMDGLEVSVADIVDGRSRLFTDLGIDFRRPDALPHDFETVFHTSATPAGLASALDALAFEGTCIELSWYGDRPVAVPLGAAFHSRRLTLRSSQVGHVAPSRRATHSRRDRLAAALDLLADPRFDRLLTEEVAFHALPAALPRLLAPNAAGIATRVRYGD